VRSPSPRSLGYYTDVAIRRLEGSAVTRESDHWRIETPANPSFYWGNFLLFDESSVARPTELLDQFQRSFPAARHVAIGVDMMTSGLANAEEFRQVGLTVESASILVADTEAIGSERQSDADIRPLRQASEWEAFVAIGMQTRDDIYDEAEYFAYLRDGAILRRQVAASGAAVWFGAFVDGQLAAHLGLYDCGAGVARYQSIVTAPDYRRQSLASDLVRVAAQFGREVFDTTTLVIAADPDYHAITLYESLGFERRESQVLIQRPSPLA